MSPDEYELMKQERADLDRAETRYILSLVGGLVLVIITMVWALG